MKSVNTKQIKLLGLVLIVGLMTGCPSKFIAPVRDADGSSPPPLGTTPGIHATAGTYVVKQGDTLYSIARIHGQSASDLVAWNQLDNPDQISIGQSLRVSPPDGLEDGPIVHPISGMAEPAVTPPADSASSLRQLPKGGVQPYSDQVWADAQMPNTGMAVAGASTLSPAVSNTTWLWPAAGQVLATFNDSTNKGIDIAGNPGDPVVASSAGTVVYSGSGLRGYGKLIIVKHDANYLTAYAHNQQLLVKEGDAVVKGQKIAEIGSTDTDRPKLHFEVRRQGRPVDPLKYLPPR